ncbi:helix-turn-helix domain-containing protein [Salicibibacter halophilus]|nr:helix-turn-helix domain-containing protein [Salicibibacter halophilus]
MFLTSLGNEIERLRTRKGITQNQLAKGICSQSTISIIEKGQAAPGTDILHYLSLKLGKPISYFINIMRHDNPTYIEDTIQYIEVLNKNHDYQELFTLTKGMVREPVKDLWFMVLIRSQYYYSAFMLEKISGEACNKHLIQLLKENKDHAELRQDYLDIRITNTIALVYSYIKKYETSNRYYTKALLLIEEINSTHHENQHLSVLTIKILFNQAKTYYDQGLVPDALETVEEAIRKSIMHENMSYIGHLFVYKGLCYERMAEPKASIQAIYKEAFYFLELLNRRFHAETLLKEKSEFIHEGD